MKNQKRSLVISTMFQQAGDATGIALGWGLGIVLIIDLFSIRFSRKNLGEHILDNRQDGQAFK